MRSSRKLVTTLLVAATATTGWAADAAPATAATSGLIYNKFSGSLMVPWGNEAKRDKEIETWTGRYEERTVDKWTVTRLRSGYYTIQPVTQQDSQPVCLQLPNEGTQTDKVVRLQTCNGQQNQKWSLRPAPGGGEWYSVCPAADPNLALTMDHLDDNGTKGHVYLNKAFDSANRLWHIPGVSATPQNSQDAQGQQNAQGQQVAGGVENENDEADTEE
ncbi:RICIN domain-containing protein [Streptomyces sp. NPDC003077]|uniref:RICIN domain-containing protein n=1 Tax=Streptomyces sp. NPDC003077 TaxID=3154443 RepID=UPI0033B7732C